jgi:hypothetical protein
MLLTMKRLLHHKSESDRLAGELEAARQVQQLLIPRAALQTEQFAADAVYNPRRRWEEISIISSSATVPALSFWAT